METEWNWSKIAIINSTISWNGKRVSGELYLDVSLSAFNHNKTKLLKIQETEYFPSHICKGAHRYITLPPIYFSFPTKTNQF